MTTMEDFRQLIDYPMERLDAEYKNWLDLTDNRGKATLAKAAIALANHGGGYIVIGFAEDGASFTSTAKPADCPEITQDIVNSAVGRYAEPAFQCAMRMVTHYETDVQHPVIIVPGSLTVPVMSRREQQGVIQQNRCYIRKPGPASEEPTTQAEWRALLNRCVRANRDEMLDAIRAIMTGQPEMQSPLPSIADELRDFYVAANGRWQELTAKLPDASPGRFPHGYYEVCAALAGATPAADLNELKRRIDAAGRISFTGWAPFLVMDTTEWRPYPYGDFTEAWLGEAVPGRVFNDAAHCDFWRASRDGKLYIIRGYDDDGRLQQHNPPGSSVNVVIPVWRIGETLLFAARLAEAFDNVEQIAVHCRFTGLEGRRLVSARLDAPLVGDRFVSKTGYVTLETQATVRQLQDNLAEVVHYLLSPLYEQFSFYELPLPVVQAQLQRMRDNRF